jgi:hypothetical protein
MGTAASVLIARNCSVKVQFTMNAFQEKVTFSFSGMLVTSCGKKL